MGMKEDVISLAIATLALICFIRAKRKGKIIVEFRSDVFYLFTLLITIWGISALSFIVNLH